MRPETEPALRDLTPTLYPRLNRAERYWAERNYALALGKVKAGRPMRSCDTPMQCARQAYYYAWRTMTFPTGLAGGLALILMATGSHRPWTALAGIALMCVAVASVLRVRQHGRATTAFFCAREPDRP